MSVQESIRNARPWSPTMASKKDPATIGERIRIVRQERDMTQETLAKLIGGIGRSGIAQWERNDSIPALPTLQRVADALQAPIEYLAFGHTNAPKIVAPNPDELGYYLVPEITFGEDHMTRAEHQKWGLPTTYLRTELGITDYRKAFVFEVAASFDGSKFELGDRLIIDGGQIRPSPPGTFLYWDGVGPALGDMVVLPNPTAKKHIVKVTTPHGAWEADADKVVVLGRVRAKLAKL